MNRRAFLSLLGAAAAGAAFDPDRALWLPGAKTISIPRPRPRYKIGDTIWIRMPHRFIARDSAGFVDERYVESERIPFTVTAVVAGEPLFDLVPGIVTWASLLPPEYQFSTRLDPERW